MFRKLHKATVLGISVLCVGTSAGCGSSSTAAKPATVKPAAAASSGSPASKHLKFDFANYTTQSVNIALLSKQFPKDASQIGDSLAVYDNNADDSTTIANAKSMVGDKPTFVFEFSSDPKIGPALQGQFKSAGIPCIGVLVPTGSCPWFALA